VRCDLPGGLCCQAGVGGVRYEPNAPHTSVAIAAHFQSRRGSSRRVLMSSMITSTTQPRVFPAPPPAPGGPYGVPPDPLQILLVSNLRVEPAAEDAPARWRMTSAST
jgi:hypothetical protein